MGLKYLPLLCVQCILLQWLWAFSAPTVPIRATIGMKMPTCGGSFKFAAQAKIKGTQLHVWSAEDSQFKNSVYDWLFDTSATASEYLDDEYAAESITLHMLLGKAVGACEARAIQLKRTIVKALQSPRTRQIIVTEHNRLSGQFDLGANPCVLSPSELANLVTEATGKASPLATFIPGKAHSKRNMMIVLSPHGDVTQREDAIKMPPPSASLLSIGIRLDNERDERVAFPFRVADGEITHERSRAFAAASCMALKVFTLDCIELLANGMENEARKKANVK